MSDKNIQLLVDSSIYQQIKNQTLFFLKYHEYEYFAGYSKKGEAIYSCDMSWQSVNKDLKIKFPADKFGEKKLYYCLCIIDKIKTLDEIKDEIQIEFHEANPNNEKDYLSIISDCITRYNQKDDKYYFVSLLWFLDKKNIHKENLIKSIQHYDNRTIPFILNILRTISRCLSIRNQNIIKEIFQSLGGEYNIYMPKIIIDAINLLNTTENTIEKDKLNIFQLIDEIIGTYTTFLPTTKSTKGQEENIFLILKKWIHSEEPLNDYSILKILFPMVAEPIRLEIVKRYFHDIRIGNTKLDCNLLLQFKDNQFDNFIRFRYSTETPSDQVILTVPLLCDNILTLYNSKGNSFQTFDGIFDFAITHCDKKHPSINFKLNRFIPTCDHGAAVYNEKFKGFIDYQIIRKFNKNKMSDDNLFKIIHGILDQYGLRQKYPICKYNNIKLDSDQFIKCSQLRIQQKDKKSYSFDCYTYKNFDNKWLVKSKHIDILNTFLKEKINNTNVNVTISIDTDMISTEVFKKYIYTISSKFTNLDNNEFIVPSYSYKTKTYNLYIIEQVTDIIKMRIFPQKALIGTNFDIFNYKGTLPANTNYTHEEYTSILTKKEIEEVTRRTIESLKLELNTNNYNGSYFELPYNRDLLVKIIKKYYFRESFNEKDKKIQHEFLTTSTISTTFKPFCAPKLSEVNNPAIDLPYFWCRGKECFHNNLNNQTLLETNDWRKYSIYHLIEIIGYPKLHKTQAGYEPDSVIRNFIAIANKVMQKFKRLKCRSCGHLMFTDKSSGFNRYNYYSCINPNCPEVNKPVYLNYCYKCKKGIIDSRDSKQCPNGWYICPTCASCCDDNQYERQAQRYILSNRPIPDRIKKMLGHGHNDKNEYFCPNCGNKLEITKDTCNKTIKKCPICHKSFSLQEEYQDEM